MRVTAPARADRTTSMPVDGSTYATRPWELTANAPMSGPASASAVPSSVVWNRCPSGDFATSRGPRVRKRMTIGWPSVPPA